MRFARTLYARFLSYGEKTGFLCSSSLFLFSFLFSPSQRRWGVTPTTRPGAVNSIVRMEVLGGNTLSATISNAAVAELGLAPGMDALAVIKATSVMVDID